MNSPAVANNQSQNINLEAVSVERGNKPFEMMRVGIKNLSEKVMELFERGVPINMLKGVSEFIAQHKRGAVLVGSSAIAMVAVTSADAVLLVNNGNFSDAIGGKTFRSSGLSNALRVADAFTVTGNGDNDLLRYQIAGASIRPGGAAGNISLVEFRACLYGESDGWNTAIDQQIVTPTNSDYTSSIGLTANGYSVHKLNFNLSSIQTFQNLTPGNYKIAVYGLGRDDSQLAGDFQRITSAQGIGDLNSYYAGIPAGTVTNDWKSTTLRPGYEDLAMNSQLEAVPEPSSIAALAMGGISLLCRRRLKSKD